MIVGLYSKLPSFPAERQNIDAVRIQINEWWVDYIGAPPTATDIDDFLTRPPQPLSAEEIYDMLESKGLLTATDRPRPKTR